MNIFLIISIIVGLFLSFGFGYRKGYYDCFDEAKQGIDNAFDKWEDL